MREDALVFREDFNAYLSQNVKAQKLVKMLRDKEIVYEEFLKEFGEIIFEHYFCDDGK